MNSLPVIALVVALSAAGWTQSVAEAARANREKPKPSTSKTITNDDLDAAKNKNVPQTPWERDLENVKTLLRAVCADPESDHGRKLSDSDRKALFLAAQPVYARRLAMEKKLEEWKAALKKVDEEEEKALIAAAPKQGFTEQDRERFLAIREDFKSRRNVIMVNAQVDADKYEQLKKELTETAEVCQESADQLR